MGNELPSLRQTEPRRAPNTTRASDTASLSGIYRRPGALSLAGVRLALRVTGTGMLPVKAVPLAVSLTGRPGVPVPVPLAVSLVVPVTVAAVHKASTLKLPLAGCQ